MPKINYDKDKQEALFMGIYMGTVNLWHLPKDLYLQTAEVIKKGLYKGYGVNYNSLYEKIKKAPQVQNYKVFEFGSPDLELLKELRENIYIFSGAKTATQVAELSSMIYKNNEKLDYNTFKKAALARFKDYNKAYLDSEYTTAMTSASTAQKFRYAEENKKILPRLKYVAIIDGSTSPQCTKSNGVILPVSHVFWNKFTPPLHFNCRCHIESLDEFDTEKTTSDEALSDVKTVNEANTDKIFKMNPAKQAIVFSDKHPYFDIGKKNPGWAHRNYNLPIPQKD